MPDGIKVIRPGTFYNCKRLASVKLPSQLQGIEAVAFWGCAALDNVILPDSLIRIGGAAFMLCSKLTSIAIPKGVSEILRYTFAYCGSLNKAELPESLRVIKRFAFLASGLHSIELPNSLQILHNCAFADCDKLTSAVIPADGPHVHPWAFRRTPCDLVSYDDLDEVTRSREVMKVLDEWIQLEEYKSPRRNCYSYFDRTSGRAIIILE